VASYEQQGAGVELDRDRVTTGRRGGERAPQEVPVWAERLVRSLDDLVRIPGTPIGIGLDAVIGFFLPGAGDALTALGSVAILLLGWRRGVPTSVLGRMLLNIGIDALVGAIPVLGDLFDVFWKSNRKNLELLQKWEHDPQAPRSAADYVVLGAALLLVLLSVLLPLVVLALLGSRLIHVISS